MDPLQAYLIWQNEKSSPRNQNPLRLAQFGYKSFSQSDEDGLIHEIIRRVGAKSRTFVEFGVSQGLECNTVALLMEGWSGLWIEGNAHCCEQIANSHQNFMADNQLRIANRYVDCESINPIISEHYRGEEVDLLSVDIDYNDYWLWKAIDCISPRVVVVEYNASWPPPAAVTVPYDPDRHWDGSSYFGASIGALAALGEQKGYKLVGCSLSGVNAFFIRDDLVQDRFFAPGDAREHYDPPRYFLATMPTGHRSAVGRVVEVSH